MRRVPRDLRGSPSSITRAWALGVSPGWPVTHVCDVERQGIPSHGRRGDPLAARLMQVALTAVMFASHANVDVAVLEVRRRAGTQLDPNLAELVERADELLADLDEIDAYQAVLDIEPEPVRRGEESTGRRDTNLRQPR